MKDNLLIKGMLLCSCILIKWKNKSDADNFFEVVAQNFDCVVLVDFGDYVGILFGR